MVRSPFMVFSKERVKNQGSTCHSLTRLKSKGCAQRQGLCIQNSDHYLTVIGSALKSDFRHHVILPVFTSLHPWEFWVSSSVVVIVKICVSSFDKKVPLVPFCRGLGQDLKTLPGKTPLKTTRARTPQRGTPWTSKY